MIKKARWQVRLGELEWSRYTYARDDGEATFKLLGSLQKGQQRGALAQRPDGVYVMLLGDFETELNHKGVLDHPVLMSEAITAGTYEVVFHVADYYRAAGVALPALPFLDVVNYRFAVGDTGQHYHLPMKLTPWGYSCFRGGA